MFVKNLTNKDFIFNKNNTSIKIVANETTLIPDGLTTISALQQMFGLYNLIEDTTGPSTSIMTNQQVCETGKLYLANPMVGENARLYVGVDGSVDVYGSDSQTPPTGYSSMDCPNDNKAVSGLCGFGILPRYISFKAKSGTPEIIITGCRLVEVGDIS